MHAHTERITSERLPISRVNKSQRKRLRIFHKWSKVPQNKEETAHIKSIHALSVKMQNLTAERVAQEEEKPGPEERPCVVTAD